MWRIYSLVRVCSCSFALIFAHIYFFSLEQVYSLSAWYSLVMSPSQCTFHKLMSNYHKLPCQFKICIIANYVPCRWWSIRWGYPGVPAWASGRGSQGPEEAVGSIGEIYSCMSSFEYQFNGFITGIASRSVVAAACYWPCVSYIALLPSTQLFVAICSHL